MRLGPILQAIPPDHTRQRMRARRLDLHRKSQACLCWDASATTPASAIDADYVLVRRSIKVLLTPERMDERPALPATYDRISRACRAVIAEAGRGKGLYDVVKMELERFALERL